MKIRKYMMTLATLGVFASSFTQPFYSQVQAEVEAFDAPSKSAIAVDFETGKILYAKNVDKVLGIASMTKLVTVYILLEQIKEGKIKWDDTVPVSDYAYKLSTDYRLSGVPLEPNHEYTVKELYEATLIASANSCAVLLAEKIATSEVKFVDLMREKVKSWGIKDAFLVNASGLNNEYLPKDNWYPDSKKDDENMMSARDVAIVSQKLIKDFPEVLDTTKKTKAVFGKGTASQVEMTTWNRMLKGESNEFQGVDGLKTGTTEKAGQCFAGTCLKNNWRILTVVQDADNPNGVDSARFDATKEIMEYAYKNWSEEVVVKKGTTFTAAKYFPVIDGKEFKVPLSLGEDVKTWVQKGMDTEDYTVVFSSKENDLEAPVKLGTTAGSVSITLNQDKYGFLTKQEPQKYDMVTSKEVEKANFFVLLGRHIMDFINDHI